LVEDKIFAEAARLFAERGFGGPNLQDIADAMGMTGPLFTTTSRTSKRCWAVC
jgi:AcrR family transcriptional regulator